MTKASRSIKKQMTYSLIFSSLDFSRVFDIICDAACIDMGGILN